MLWLLMIAGAVPVTGAAPVAPPPGEPRLICKQMMVTGSLARRTKVCRTGAEWDKVAWAARLGTQSLQDSNMGRPLAE